LLITASSAFFRAASLKVLASMIACSSKVGIKFSYFTKINSIVLIQKTIEIFSLLITIL
jgi:hypothetical protein